MPIPRTDAEIVPEGMTLLQRLGRHLSALESGDTSAGDDLAAVLRILIEPKGHGNQAVVRLAKATNLALPNVLVSGAPEPPSTAGLLLAFGNLPVVPGPLEIGQPHAPRSMPFRQWVDAISLVVPTSQRKSESWGSFANLTANTRGSHMSTEYHDLLVTSDLFGSVGLSLQHYLLRQIGWQVERVLADLLFRAGQTVIPRTRPLDFWPRMLVWGWFKDTPGVGTELMVAINVTSDDGPPVEVMKYLRRGRTHRVYHGGAQVQLTMDEPEPAA